MRNNFRGRYKHRTLEKIARIKKTSTCKSCKQRGHWAGDSACSNSNKNTTDEHTNKPTGTGRNSTGTITFHMVHIGKKNQQGKEICSNQFTTRLSNKIVELGPLIADGAPYSGIGHEEFLDLQASIMPCFNGVFDPLPPGIINRPFWQYGSGKHASPRKKIIGSICLNLLSDEGTNLQMRHLIIQGSSPWIIERNVTSQVDIIHRNGNYLEFSVSHSNTTNTLGLINSDLHSYLPRHKFSHNKFVSVQDPHSEAICSHTSDAVLSWNDKKNIINRVHKHTCGHSNYKDIKLLLQRNKIWDENCVGFLSYLLESCPHCAVVSQPSRNRTVSLRSMSSNFNDVVCVDHFFLNNMDVFHAMDYHTRYSAGTIVESPNMEYAIQFLEAGWISPFWTPAAIRGDQAFNNSIFLGYLSSHSIYFQPIPPRRHSKNAIESKHRIIRDILFGSYHVTKPQSNLHQRDFWLFRLFRYLTICMEMTSHQHTNLLKAILGQ